MGFTDETTTKADMGNLLRPQNISALLTSPVLKEVMFMCLLTIILVVLLAIAFALAIVWRCNCSNTRGIICDKVNIKKIKVKGLREIVGSFLFQCAL